MIDEARYCAHIICMLEGQIKHLEMIQATIARMGHNSFAMKGWAVTVVTGAVVVLPKSDHWMTMFLALIPAFLFWGLDAYYLKLEKRFRGLFDKVRLMSEDDWSKDPFTLHSGSVRSDSKSWLQCCIANCVVWLYVCLVALVLIAARARNLENVEKEGFNNGQTSVLQLPVREGCDSSWDSSQQLVDSSGQR